ncbi:secreted RxLR effector protein 161-like [Benincasa hispida]|uniref:secreted RxLR effector protein 161-like n=1 Tax=Benincasa hispida TaxID=102211 RepID=UPI0019002CC1|nr:secreted RxLR effector protein 161-like [Benincasa hispida]
MTEAKIVHTPIAHHCKLSLENSPKETNVEHLKQMSTVPYSQSVGSLMYLMISTRPNIACTTSLIGRYMANTGKRHWKATKWIMRYLKGIMSARLLYQQTYDTKSKLIGYVDSDYAEDLDRRRSLSGHIFLYGSCVLSWKATLQSVVALSTTEIEGKRIEVLKIHTSNNASDMLIKAMTQLKLKKYLDIIGFELKDKG